MRGREGMTRRGFLSGTVGATVAAASLAGEKPRRWEMRLSTSSIHYLHLPVEKACERIAKLGFEGVDIWSAHAGCPHLDDVLKRLGPEGLKKVLAGCGLKLFAFSVYRGGYQRYAELLGKAGGGVAVRGSTRAARGAELVPRMKKFIDGLKPLVELAEKYDSYLAIENHGGALVNTLDSLKAFVDNNTSPRLGIALAPFHLQGIKASVPEAIRICGKQLFFFYAWQRGRGTRQLPGHGPTDFTPWLAALGEVGYKGYVNPFMHGDIAPDEMDKALAKARDYLKSCYHKAFS